MPAENLTLYAVWSKTPPTAKITLHYDDKVQIVEAEIGTELDMLDDFGVTKDGEIVSGWYFENSPVRIENLDVTEDCDVYAKWKSATYITITVDRSYLNKLTAILADLHTDREALRKLPIDPERKLPVFKITIGETEYTDRKEAAKALEDAVLAIKYADTPVKVGSFQGFDLSVTVNSNMMGGGMSAGLQGATSHTTKLIESFAHNLNRLEAALYNIDGRIERTQDNLAKLRLDHAEAQKIVAEPFPQQEELDTKEQRLKVVTDELNQAAIEAKKNAPKREKTCYFERAKMKRDAARLGKKPKTPKDQTKGRSKKQGIE